MSHRAPHIQYSFKDIENLKDYLIKNIHEHIAMFPNYYVYFDGDGELMFINTKHNINTKQTHILEWFDHNLNPTSITIRNYIVKPSYRYLFKGNESTNFVWPDIARTNHNSGRTDFEMHVQWAKDNNPYYEYINRFFDPTDEEDLAQIQWIIDNIGTLESI